MTKVLNKLKQNRFIIGVERKGYYISQNTSSYFFYSVNDFNSAKQVKTSLLWSFKISNKIVKIINTKVKKFKSFIVKPKRIVQRKYYYDKNVEKESYFIFKYEDFKNFKNVDLLNTKPLYEFLSLNGIIIARNTKFGFFSDFPLKNTKYLKKRSWVIIEFIYDINDLPIAILFINYFDQNSSNILYERDWGIN